MKITRSLRKRLRDVKSKNDLTLNEMGELIGVAGTTVHWILNKGVFLQTRTGQLVTEFLDKYESPNGSKSKAPEEKEKPKGPIPEHLLGYSVQEREITKLRRQVAAADHEVRLLRKMLGLKDTEPLFKKGI